MSSVTDGNQSSGTSSSDVSPEAEDYRSLSQSSDTDSEDRHPPTSRRGIVNPNYPGFQHFASQLHSSDSEDDTCSLNNNNINNNNVISGEDEVSGSVNQLDIGSVQKTFYDKSKLNISDLCNQNQAESVTKMVTELNIPLEFVEKEAVEKCYVEDFSKISFSKFEDVIEVNHSVKESNNKMADAFLSGVKDEIPKCEDTNRAGEEFEKEVSVIEDTVVPRKKEKMELSCGVKRVKSQPVNAGAHQPPANMPPRSLSLARRSANREKKRSSPESLGKTVNGSESNQLYVKLSSYINISTNH